MEQTDLLCGFLSKASLDARIGISHVSLYTTLWRHWVAMHLGENPITAYGAEVASWARISPRSYHTLVLDLDRYGYLKYEPSFYKAKRSKIYLLM